MIFTNKMKASLEMLRSFVRQPRLGRRFLRTLPFAFSGVVYAQNWGPSVPDRISGPCSGSESVPESSNPLRAYFDSHTEGRGIWKLVHYFDIYHRHFGKFVGREVHVLEVGIYSGGSLEMWKEYFGPKCQVYGVDIQEACKVYEDERTKIFVGDQADRAFWKLFKEQAPAIDIIIDDGGHQTEQQIVTLEEMLPHLRPGGVYLCEDTLGAYNGFAAYAQALADNLNKFVWKSNGDEAGRLYSASTTEFQKAIRSIHLYPFVTVIEKADSPADEFIAPRHGTQWQPFL